MEPPPYIQTGCHYDVWNELYDGSPNEFAVPVKISRETLMPIVCLIIMTFLTYLVDHT